MKLKKEHAADTAASRASEQDAFWLEMPDGIFLLKVDGKTRAAVFIDLNAADVLSVGAQRLVNIVAPDSDVVFDVVEAQLGLGRVTKFQSLSGPCRTDWRSVTEQRAERFRQTHPANTEAEYYCRAALHALDQKSRRGLLESQARSAHRHLQQAAILLKASNHIWTPEACAKLVEAYRALRAEWRSPDLQQPTASLACRKAIAVLEREGILKLNTDQSPDARTARPDAPAYNIPSKPDRAYYQVHSDGMFSLKINGQTRARIGLEVNTANILDMTHGGHRQISAPNSEVIFDVVEAVLGLRRVTEFRTETGISDIDWRGMAEQQARWFRQDCPPQAEAEFYCRAARSLLSEKSALDGLSPEASAAHHHLREAIVHLDANNGNWSVEALEHLDQARQFLRDAPVEATTIHEPEAQFHCEKAAAVLVRDGIIARTAPYDRSGDDAAHGPANACWVDLGRGRYDLLIDGEQHAIAYAGLNIVSVRDPDSLRQTTIAAMDSETIFDAAESRLGIPPVTNIMPEHREQVRAELSNLAAEFHDLHPQDAEPAFYIERALQWLGTAGASETHSDIVSARLHLGKALEALQQGESLAEAARQVDHACQYLPTLSASPSFGDQRAMNAAADCDRALRSIERNRSQERAGTELTPAFSAARGRTI